MDGKWVDANVKLIWSESYNHTPSLLARTSFFYVQSAGHFCCSSDYCTRRQGYRSYLLIYTVKGRGYAKFRKKDYILKAGQVLLIDCYEYQEYYSDPDDLWEIKWIHFFGNGSSGYFNNIYENYGPVLDMKDDLSIQCSIDEILGMLKDKDIKFEVKASCIILQILTRLIMANTGSKPDDNHRYGHNLQMDAAIEFMEKNYDKDILLDDIAKAACSSKFNFSRVFKKISGYSPYEYLIRCRMNKAKELLKNSGEAIEEIAGNVGFRSTSNFVRTFRELEGLTPAKYRKYWLGK